MIVVALFLQAAAPLPAPIGRQALPARGCAAFLWSRGPEPALVAMATSDPAAVRLALAGRPTDYPRGVQDGGDAGFGFAHRTEYILPDGTATLELALAARPDLAQGAAVTGATLTIVSAAAGAVVVPLGGLVGCAAATR